MTGLALNPYTQFLDDAGIPVQNGTIEVFENKTATPTTIFTDQTALTPQANPYTLDASGRIIGDVYWAGFRTVKLSDQFAAEIRTLDFVTTLEDASTFYAPSKNTAIEFNTVADMISGTLPDGSTIALEIGQVVNTKGYTTIGNGGDNTYEIVAAGTGTDDGGSFIDLNTLQSKGLFPQGMTTLAQFGGVNAVGQDLTKAAGNSAALEAAVNFISGPLNTVDKGGTVTLGKGDWTFSTVDLQERWGWKLDGSNAKIFLDGLWDLGGAAYFDLDMGWLEATTAQSLLITGFHFHRSTANNERTHNMTFKWKLLTGFIKAIHYEESFSQVVLGPGQFAGNVMTIDGESGGENVVIEKTISATNTVAPTAPMKFTNGNPILTNNQFETLPGTDRPEIELVNPFGTQIDNNLFVTSGGIKVSGGGFASITDNTISNSISTNVIDVQTPDIKCNGNRIRFNVNDGSGTIYTDGTGKTAISTTAGFSSCEGNSIRRADTGVLTTSTSIQAYSNDIADCKTQAYLLNGGENVKIVSGSISLDQAGQKGIVVTGVNGNGNRFADIAWSGITSDRYVLSAGNGQNSVVIDGGPNDPETDGIIAGSGSIYSAGGGAQGACVYHKSLFGTGSDNWIAVGPLLRTTAQILDETDFCNTVSKEQGRSVYNTTTEETFIANGTSTTATWTSTDGATVLTPS